MTLDPNRPISQRTDIKTASLVMRLGVFFARSREFFFSSQLAFERVECIKIQGNALKLPNS